MATVKRCKLSKEYATIYPQISLTRFLAGLGDIVDIAAKLNKYELYDQQQARSTEEIARKYFLMKKGDRFYHLYAQYGFTYSEYWAYDLLKHYRCPYLLKPKIIEADGLSLNLFIIPHYNNYCRTTLRPFVKTVMRQLLKALVCLRKQYLDHKVIRPESITWRWNKARTKPHIYLINFDKIVVGDRSMMLPYQYDWTYDICEYDVRLAGILMLELLLDQDIYAKYANVNCLIPPEDRLHYYTQIGCTVTCDLLEELIGASPVGRISAKQALKHKYFRSKRTV